MKKVPRDLSTEENGNHHVTIPKHNPLKTGTLSNIFKDIASHMFLCLFLAAPGYLT